MSNSKVEKIPVKDAISNLNILGISKDGTSSDVDLYTSKQVDIKTSKRVYKRHTFYLFPEQVERIKAISFYHKLPMSQIARDAIQGHINKIDVEKPELGGTSKDINVNK